MRIVDAHVHLWDVEAFPIPWFRADLGLPRAATARALRRSTSAVRAASVDAAIAVQVADTPEEARWLTELVRHDPRVTRAVLQYEPAEDATARPLGATVMPETVFSGIRAAVPQFAADLSDVPGLDALAAALGERGGVLELLIRPEQLTGTAALAARHPNTDLVLCHLGLGYREPDDAWRADLTAFAAHPRTHAKFSGLLSPARTDAELAAIAADAVAAFGAERLMFGSDWPMSARVHAYPQVVQMVHRAMSDAAGAAFWAGTAERLYR